MAVKKVTNGIVSAASVTTTDPSVAAYHDLSTATTAAQVRAAFAAHRMVGYKKLIKMLPAPARTPKSVTGTIDVETVVSCQNALRRAKTAQQVSGIIIAHRTAFNGRTDRITGMLLAYDNASPQRIVEG